MIPNKQLEIVILFLVVIGLAASLFIVERSGTASATTATQGTPMEYENKIFSRNQIVTLDIQMDAASWQNLLDNALEKTYYSCNVVINGETFHNVGIRTKGGSSLEDVKAMGTSKRYSFLLNFNKYVKGQAYYGPDRLALNNNYSDATSMKDAVTYDMFAYLNTEAPLYNYVSLSLNGEYFGCYLALESVRKSFSQRNFGDDYGKLYKPVGGAMGHDGGASLSYTDDNPDSYRTIWETTVFSAGKEDHQRVVDALKSVHTGRDIESHVDIDNILKYMAVQTVVVNLDGLTGRDINNYFLHEKDRKLRLIPWDYNLAFSGYTEEAGDEGDWDESWDENWDESSLEQYYAYNTQEPYGPEENAAVASKSINLPIDTPFTGDLQYRSFFMALLLYMEKRALSIHPDGTPKYESTLVYAILKREWEVMNIGELAQ